VPGPGEGKARNSELSVKVLQEARAAAAERATINGVKVLIVEDEDSIAAPLVDGLRREGFEVIRAADGAQALAAPKVDLVLLDLRLPDVDGLTVCRRLREHSDVPIIVVTAKGEEIDRVVGLELGADDYIVKPFGFRELLARIRAVMRRARPDRDGRGRSRLRAGPLEVDLRSRAASLNGEALNLTAKELDLLALLLEEPGAVVSRPTMLERVWNTTWYGNTKTIDVHVASLRRKLGDADLIQTVRGVGFRLRPPE